MACIERPHQRKLFKTLAVSIPFIVAHFPHILGLFCKDITYIGIGAFHFRIYRIITNNWSKQVRLVRCDKGFRGYVLVTNPKRFKCSNLYIESITTLANFQISSDINGQSNLFSEWVFTELLEVKSALFRI